MSTTGGRRVDRVALVGLPGTGKSEVGPRLAGRLGWRFVDTDAEVEAATGQRISEVFAREGEAGFRRRELEALGAALDTTAVVVACGGGVVTQPEAVALIRRRACVVWLDAADAVLLRRLGDAADRPLLSDDPPRRLAELRAARAELYGAGAPLRVDVAAHPEEVADRVADAVGGARLPAAEWTGDAPVQRVAVELGDRSYPVLIGDGISAQLHQHVPPTAARVVVVADRAVIGLARDLARGIRQRGRAVSVVPVSGGEPIKTWAAAGRLLDRLAGAGLDRADCVVAVGGGSVGDLCGFAAATYQRGIAHLQVPTTLLGMVDSAIGGKTGVNLRAGKNLAGAFWQPRAVLCDPAVLGTLGERPYRAALAEIIKTAMIAPGPLPHLLDARLPALLARDPETLVAVVAACSALKAAVVGADEREAGGRMVLNYGHTVGHALEAETGYGDALLHGEAVACGMRVAGRLSVELCGCPPADVAWQDELLARGGLGALPEVDAAAVVARTHADKKARAGRVGWVLLERRGAATTGHHVVDEDVYNVLRGLAA